MRKESKGREIKMKREKKEKWKWKEKRKRNERIKKQERRENINLFIQINRHTDRQTDGRTDGQIDRHKSFIDMKYYTEQYSKSNSIEEKKIKSNQFEIK